MLEHKSVCPGEPDPCECEPEVITDERSSRLRVLRYDFAGEPVEVLSMPFAADYDSPRPKIIADAFADRIALSLVVEGLGPIIGARARHRRTLTGSTARNSGTLGPPRRRRPPQ